MSIYKEILTWLENRPAWQSDCVRRLLTQEKLSEQDLTDLTNLCKQAHGLCEEITAQPLREEHILQPAGSQGKVVITSIEETKDINALTPNQTLKFSEAGLTVVYGDNGSGKSGYARVLKQLCRARGGGKAIKPNAYAAGPKPKASAIIKFEVSGHPAQINWIDGAPGPAALSMISVFDSACASVYVGSETDIAFMPAGLDIFAKLARVSESVATAIQSDIKSLDSLKKTFVGFTQESAVGKAVLGLSPDTDVKKIEKVATEAQEETTKISEVQQQLADLEANDPKKVAKELRLKATRLQKLYTRLDHAIDLLSDESTEKIKNYQTDAVTKRKAAKLASVDFFKNEPLSGIGTDTWQSLWESAREFSQSYAYPGQVFPVTGDEAACLLCQQPLSEEASTRLNQFDLFVKAAAQEAAKTADTKSSSAFNLVKEGNVSDPNDESAIAELKALDENCAVGVSKLLSSFPKRRAAVIAAYETETWSQLEAMPTAVMTDFQDKISALEAKAKELDNIDVAKEITAKRKSMAELQARQLLLKHKDEIVNEVLRHKKRKLFEGALRDTNTTGITSKSTELSKAVVTKALCNRFAAEIRELGLETIQIQLNPAGGSKGALLHKISLSGASAHAVDEIASEGEHRAIALAAFLAELATEHSSSALVFDDPVTSLDHVRRGKVAARLIKESAERQVVIFTHDISFVMLLNEAHAKNTRIPRVDAQVTRRGDVPGFCVEGLPWGGLTAEKRLGALKNDAQNLIGAYKSLAYEDYGRRISQLYGRLREAWERAVEGVLFNGVINRLERPVHTLKLSVVDVVASDYDAVLLGMGTCSKWLDGHDEPSEMNEPFPSPEEVMSDVKNLETWIKMIKDRRELVKLKSKNQIDSTRAHLTVVGKHMDPQMPENEKVPNPC